MDTFQLVGLVAGGLGLFILAIEMMTDGLKQAAGSGLKVLLSSWSSHPVKGILSGTMMTAVVQSSSAVTVAALGFANAGILSMRQAIGIIYGANIGTTVTGWLVALVGFKFSIQAFALPMIAMGVLLKLTKPSQRASAFGVALVGFGLFFVGIDFLKEAFSSIVEAFDLTRIKADGITGIFLFLLIGTVMTILTQSSSASIALIITAASTDVVGLYAAGAMVIGANIGTTTTALLASVGATANAMRVATAQVIFNLSTGVVALVLLPVILFAIEKLSVAAGLNTNVAFTLAIFHTAFNVAGVVLFYPITGRLADFLEQRFRSREQIPFRPHYIDKNVADTPDLAVNAAALELNDILLASLADYQTIKLLASAYDHSLSGDIPGRRSLCEQVSEFVVGVQQSSLNERTAQQLMDIMLANQETLAMQTSLSVLIQKKISLPQISTDLEERFLLFFELTQRLSDNLTQGQLPDTLLAFEEAEESFEQLRRAMIRAAALHQVKVSDMTQLIDFASTALSVIRHAVRASEKTSEIIKVKGDIQQTRHEGGGS
ncbi:Na/Pi cotransporter family protein [uncultured Thalassolituus sp.]|uniref:Na/Pi cotransporter family protein n=1 Tax=uncultured Thalassolituus sp. TaxID=285273 RepID=UPI00261C7340|nr:Na/Pi symporter [uncultured Thalassolituus sp.]